LIAFATFLNSNLQNDFLILFVEKLKMDFEVFIRNDLKYFKENLTLDILRQKVIMGNTFLYELLLHNKDLDVIKYVFSKIKNECPNLFLEKTTGHTIIYCFIFCIQNVKNKKIRF